MSGRLRPVFVVGLALAALGASLRAVDAPLPPEPAGGEWIEDRLDDDSLWFASSENVDFERVARELRGPGPGRRWVRVVDGRPAWVMYFIPGEILGFEVDTHHFGASATDFRFAVGSHWRDLVPVDVDFEEIVDFESKWLRLYRTAQQLPAGSRFLRIEFPAGTDHEFARLTEVWLRCRLNLDPADEGLPPEAPAATPAPTTPAGSNTPTSPAVEPQVEALVVTAVRPVAPPDELLPASHPVEAVRVPAEIALQLPLRVSRYDLVGAIPLALEPPSPRAEMPPRHFFARVVNFLHRQRAW